MTPEIILGPPGTGKTTRLLDIVDSELERGVPPDRIGYFSFTRRAAREAVERASKKFGLEPKQLPWFRTLHSACFAALGLSSSDVLEKNKLVEFGDWCGVRVTGSVNMEEGAGATFGAEVGDRILFMENLSRIRCVTLREQYDIYNDDLEWREVQRVAEALRDYKKARHLVDYTDMLSHVANGEWSPGLEVLVVDESQDLSRLQWLVVDRLARGVRRVVVAGDDDQAIYRWAGADVENFISMRGEVTVLGQSWRVPILAQGLAHDIISRVPGRRPKEWSPRPEQGTVRRVRGIEDADLSGSVLILARNAFVIKRDVEPLLRSDGAIYEFRGHGSVRPAVLEAIVAWESLRRGEGVLVSSALRAYEQMTSGQGVRRGFKTLPGFRPDQEVTLAELSERGGLMTDAVWHRAMDRLPQDEKAYILRALRKGEKLRSEPRVRISTIHGSKGGEADHVVIMTDMAQRTYREMQENPEDEARVFYVATTRTRRDLTIVSPRTSRAYDL